MNLLKNRLGQSSGCKPISNIVKKENLDQDLSSFLSYHNLFWLFMIGNVFGVLLEGIWTFFLKGVWETHVITIWGPFCLIYGVGLVVIYVISIKLHNKNIILKFLSFAIILDLIEYIASWMIDYFLDLRAWNYSRKFMNLHGRICLEMTLIWGIVGVLFAHFLIRQVNKLLSKMQGKIWKGACIILSVFMIINIMITGVCIVRWSQRHNEITPRNLVEAKIDHYYDDTFMQRKFIEWKFIR